LYVGRTCVVIAGESIGTMDILGIDIMGMEEDYLKRKYEHDDEVMQLLEDSIDGKDNMFACGPICKVGDHIVHPFVTCSPSSGITGEIFTKFLQHIDDHMNDDCTITTPTLLLDGHGSRFEEYFLRNEKQVGWPGRGIYSIFTPVLILQNRILSQPSVTPGRIFFAEEDSNRTAIAVRGWNPLNYNLDGSQLPI